MKRARIFVVAVFLIVIVLAPTILVLNGASAKNVSNQSFYVGVTYCGSSVQEAKELVDKVKDYTNLFVLSSGILQNGAADVNAIGDYVVASNLKFAVSNAFTIRPDTLNEWANAAKERWGEQFIGLYYRDEPGGDMLDKTALSFDLFELYGVDISRLPRGAISTYDWGTKTDILYYFDGSIEVMDEVNEKVIYWPNGTIVTRNNDAYTVTENITAYEQVARRNPLKNYDDAAEIFVNDNRGKLGVINKTQLSDESILVFTADYGLYWWDYQSGYDVVLAELAWNHSVAQQIGLVRGAANLQGKSWGTCITWKYTHPPYLTDGGEMFEQMKTSYEAGAEYVLIFNYSEDPANPNTLQEEHFLALERFWEDVVQNPDVVHGGIKAEAVLVLPQNYGWGMRAKDDNIWGIWSADETSVEIWSQIESKIDQYGVKLDIVFKDSNYPVTGKYDHIYYCGTSQPTFSSLTEFFTSIYVWVIAGALLLSVTAGVVLIRFRHRKK